MQSVTYRRRNYLFAVRRKVVDDQLGWTICMRSPRTHEWLPVLGERPFTSSVAAEARLADLARTSITGRSRTRSASLSRRAKTSKKGWRGCGPAVLRTIKRM